MTNHELLDALEETVATLLLIQIAWRDKFSEKLSNMVNSATKLGTDAIQKARLTEESSDD